MIVALSRSCFVGEVDAVPTDEHRRRRLTRDPMTTVDEATAKRAANLHGLNDA
jgi:hypothetical protein